jgi:LPXTG-motif cell wall-anchored protein
MAPTLASSSSNTAMIVIGVAVIVGVAIMFMKK